MPKRKHKGLTTMFQK